MGTAEDLRRKEVKELEDEVSRLLELEISNTGKCFLRVTERLMEMNVYLSIAKRNLDPKDWVVTVQGDALHGVGRHQRLLPALWIAIIVWMWKVKNAA